ncbi:siphovirus Gp157 family protein [Kozakia baliensis]|uniref:siphovirus Gp157 family protein n=1 Tax=Kozakia baliensis TaxID=153496 RepID=UPI00345B6106
MSEVLDRANDLHRDAIKPAFDAYVEALKAMRAANDPDGPAIAAIVSLEALQKAAKEMESTLRAKVTASLDESGVLGFEAGAYEVSRVRPKPQADVLDLEAIRHAAPDLFEPQPDKLNKTELTKRLRKGEEIPGAQMGVAPTGHIAIRSKK